MWYDTCMKNYPLRVRFSKDIIAEILLPPKQIGRVLILLGGAPSMPSKPDVMRFWAEKGYTCVLPRLRGTWESGGEFLAQDPVLDIFDIVNEITSKNFVGIQTIAEPLEKKMLKLKVKTIFVLGASFGGTGAVLASQHPKVKKVVALAPVIDWSFDAPLEPFECFQEFTRLAFGDAYRGKASSWKKMQQNKIFSPLKDTKKVTGKKVLIIHAGDDDVVLIDPVYSFIRDTGAALVEPKRGGHFGLNDTRKKKFSEIIIKHFN